MSPSTANKLSPMFVPARAYPWPLCYPSIRRYWRCMRALRWRFYASNILLAAVLGAIAGRIFAFATAYFVSTDEGRIFVVCCTTFALFGIAIKDSAQQRRAKEDRLRDYHNGQELAQNTFIYYTYNQTVECLDRELQAVRLSYGAASSYYFVECLLFRSCACTKLAVARWAVQNGARGIDPLVYQSQSALHFAIYNDNADADITRLLLFECGVPLDATMIYRNVTDSVKRTLLAAVVSHPYDPPDPMAEFDGRTLRKHEWHNRWENPHDAIPHVVQRNTSLMILHSAAQAIIDDRLRPPPELYPEDDAMQRCGPGAGRKDATWMGHLPDELLLMIVQRVARTSHYSESAANVVRLAASCRRWRRVAADKTVANDVVANSHAPPRTVETDEHTEWARKYVFYPWSWIYVLGTAATLKDERVIRATMLNDSRAFTKMIRKRNNERAS